MVDRSHDALQLRATSLGLRRPGSSGVAPVPAASAFLVRGLELALEPGRVTVIVGPNGSGKTTLLRTLLGLARASEGEVWLGDRPLLARPLAQRAQQLAWLPQRSELAWSMPVERLVMLGRAPHLSPLAGPRLRDHRAVDEALQRLDIAHLRERDVLTLSGGELQRVLVARMLAGGAPTLILDEPTTALDIGHALALLELARELADAGHTLLLSLHELELARRHADRVLLLTGDEAGSWQLGPTAEVLAPERLSAVFRVDASLRDDRLYFAPLTRHTASGPTGVPPSQ